MSTRLLGGRLSRQSVTIGGRLVRSIGKAQTFLSGAQVHELIAAYREGHSLRGVAEKCGIYHRTAVAHLVPRGEPVRRRPLSEAQIAEAVRLYEGGMTLLAVGRELGVSQATIRRVVASFVITYPGVAPLMALTTDLVVSSVPPEKTGGASGLAPTANDLGISLGVTVIGSVGIAAYRGNIESSLPDGLPPEAAPAA